MMTIKDHINMIQKKQRTVDCLLEAGILAKDDVHYESEKKDINVDILYQKEATIGIGCCNGKAIMQEHAHENSKHYLICISGRFVIKFEGLFRVLAPGDCLSLDAGVSHTTQCIKEGKLVFINVPADNQWG